MRLFRLLSLLPLLCLFASAQEKQAVRSPLEKPNVIIIFLDDAGYGDFGFTGNKKISTPKLDKLASQSLNLTSFYAGSPACTASRYCMLTGKSPARSGFARWVLRPDDVQFINKKHTIIPETLKKAGYVTGMIGKWHLGVPTKANKFNKNSLPGARGFDTYIGIPYSNDMDPSPLLKQPGDSEQYPSAELTELPVNQQNLTRFYFEEACSFVEKNKTAPFFLYLTPSMPHYPLYASEGFEGKAKSGRLYDDVIQEIDASVGKLVETVDKSGIGNNTLIIFSSDNGPWLIKGNDAGRALPFRDGKGSNFEGGVRVPGLMRWSGVIKPGKSDSITSVADVHPTVAALAGQKIETQGSLDGRNISYLFNPKFPAAKPEKEDDYALVLTGAGNNKIMTVRKGKWKLHVSTFSQLWSSKIKNHNSPRISASRTEPLLYDLSRDVAETTNVADRNKKVVEELLQEIDTFRESVQNEHASN